MWNINSNKHQIDNITNDEFHNNSNIILFFKQHIMRMHEINNQTVYNISKDINVLNFFRNVKQKKYI